MNRNPQILSLVLGLCLLNACGGGMVTPPPPSPTVTISAAPNTITLAQSAALTWTTTNATSCTASANPSEADWTGPVAPNGNGSVTPAATGTVVYTLNCNGAGGTASQSAPVAVNPRQQLAITSPPPPVGIAGSNYDYHCGQPQGTNCSNKYEFINGFVLTASGGLPPLMWRWAEAAGSSTPPGMKIGICLPDFRGGTLICGIPSAAGSYKVTVTVTDSASPQNQASADYTISIDNPPPPTISSLAHSNAELNLPYSSSFAASKGFAPLTWNETGALPVGFTFDTTSGTLAGTPTAVNSFPITVGVTDALGRAATTVAFTLHIFLHGFKPTGEMSTPRAGHTATLLDHGTVLDKVLVAGGGTDSAELYDPANGGFTPTTGMMTAVRFGNTATLLANGPAVTNGKVLLAGGNNSDGGVALAELFDPATGTFAATAGAVSILRYDHSATLLNNGKVLLLGGTDASTGNDTATADVFDPVTGTFTPTVGSLSVARRGHSATLLSGGKVLIVGGLNGGGDLATAELFDPTTGTFSLTNGSMAGPRVAHQAVPLSHGPASTNGKVLIVGGFDGNGPAATAEVFDPATQTFTATTGSMADARLGFTATLLDDGTVLAAGGENLSTAELFDPTTGAFSGTGDMSVIRSGQTATLLNDGTVLLTGGGVEGSPTMSADLFE